MNYFSVCDGIGAAHAAFLPLGWKCTGICEIDKCCNQLVAEKYGFYNFGDFSEWETWREKQPERWDEVNRTTDCIVGGTPCQAFSIAGKRQGIADKRGSLTLRFIDFVCENKPQWFIWENVPGSLTVDNGRLFSKMLYSYSECGYGVAWRVLNARYFGIAQHRRRVFLVGCLGDGKRAAKVLFDGIEVSENFTTRKTTAIYNQRTAELGTETDCFREYVTGTIRPVQGGIEGRDSMLVPDLKIKNKVRKLIPIEVERCFGFPDNYTAGFSDTQRYKMLGNSICVPVLKWIGERIEKLNNMDLPATAAVRIP